MAGFLVLLLVSAASFLLIGMAVEVLRKAFEQYRLRYLARSIRDLSAMFLFIDAPQLLRLNLAAMLVLAAAGAWLGGPLLAAVFATAGFFAPAVAVPSYRRWRVRRFDGQLTDALHQMANALRAGLTLQQAIDQVAREAPSPLRQEFGLFVKEVKLAVPLDEALSAMAARVGSEDLDLVATSTVIARQLGGNLAEMFEGIAATIRERFRLEGRIAALTSQGRLQGLIISALPIAVGLFFNSYRPDLVAPMFESGHGHALVAAIVLLQSAGFLTIRRIVAVDV